MAAPSERPPRSSRPDADFPRGALGGAPPLGRGSVPDSSEVRSSEGRLKTTPLRPLIDIAAPGLTLTVLLDGGQTSARSVNFEGEVCRIGTHPSTDLTL